MRELRGMPVVNALIEKYSGIVEEKKKEGIIPQLAIVRVGNREDDLAYERGILKRFDQAGAKACVHELPADADQRALEDKLTELDSDPLVHGILLFRPLPKHLNEDSAKRCVSPRKDVDCMRSENQTHVYEQDGKGHMPCTPEAVMEMLKFYEVDLTGKKVVIVGRSLVVGKPLAMMMLKANATVTICHTKTANLSEECKRADIICAAAGKAKMLGAEHFGKDQIIVDVGINMLDGKLCGDVDYEAAAAAAEAVTPVPGGVGSVTTTMLLKHVLKAAGAEL